MENGLPEADWIEQIAYVCGFREIFRIEGESMLPTLKAGDVVLINPYATYAVGDVVLAQHPFRRSVKIIKRIARITDEGRYFLLGDNAPESTDSRSFGALRSDDILGRAEARINED